MPLPVRPPVNSTPLLLFGGGCVILVYYLWPYLIASLALIGLIHLWNLYHQK